MSKATLYLVIALLPVAAASPAIAGQGADRLPVASFEELDRRQVLKAGDTIWITYAGSVRKDGRSYTYTEPLESEAEVLALTGSAISLRIDGARVELPAASVRRIELRASGKRWGVLVGGAIGAGLGALVGRGGCAGNGALGSCDEAALFGALIGGAAGAGIGAIAQRPSGQLVYRAADSTDAPLPEAALALSPLLSEERKGLLFSVIW